MAVMGGTPWQSSESLARYKTLLQGNEKMGTLVVFSYALRPHTPRFIEISARRMQRCLLRRVELVKKAGGPFTLGFIHPLWTGIGANIGRYGSSSPDFKWKGPA